MDIIDELQQVMEKRDYSQAYIGRAIGYSSATVNQLLQRKYNGDQSGIHELIAKFLRRDRQRESHQEKYHFVKTDSASKGLTVIDYAHTEGEICVLHGAAGLGKTMILKEYARQNPEVILIEADPGYTARVLLEELCRHLGLTRRGTIHDMTDTCVQALKDSGRLVMIDEAEMLHYRSLEVLRRLHDKTGVGVVLAGMPRLIVNLTGRKGEYSQLYSRVALAFCLGVQVKSAASKVRPVNPSETLPREDFSLIAADLLPEASIEEISYALYEGARGNARRLYKLSRGVRRMCDVSKTDISVAAIQKFAEMLIH
jgi:hypothetical protein